MMDAAEKRTGRAVQSGRRRDGLKRRKQSVKGGSVVQHFSSLPRLRLRLTSSAMPVLNLKLESSVPTPESQWLQFRLLCSVYSTSSLQTAGANHQASCLVLSALCRPPSSSLPPGLAAGTPEQSVELPSSGGHSTLLSLPPSSRASLLIMLRCS